MNTTANGSNFRSCSSLINRGALKIERTVALSLILVVSLVGNFLIVLIVYKTPTLRKPINMLIANMAMSDLLYPIFLPPSTSRVSRWLVDYWWYPWPSFMQATHLSCECFWGSIDSEPGSDSSGSIWSCCSSTPLSSHN